MPSMCAENLAMAGAAFAIAMMSKDTDRRGEGLSASLSAIFTVILAKTGVKGPEFKSKEKEK